MNFNKKINKWIATLGLATTFLFPNPAAYPQQKRYLHLEKPILRKAEIKDSIFNKVKGTLELKLDYNPENKEICFEIYTPDWNKKKENVADLDKEYINIRDDSKFYMICKRENFEFDYITSEGYFIELDKNRNSFGEWKKLIDFEKNPDAKLKILIRKKALSNFIKETKIPNFIPIITEILEYSELKKEVELEKIAYTIGKDYEVREIEIGTAEGLFATRNTAVKINIKLRTNPETEKKTILFYDIKMGSSGSPIASLSANGEISFIVPGERERKVQEQTLDDKILATLTDYEDKEEWRKYLGRIPLSIKKYFFQKEDIPNNYRLISLWYSSGLGMKRYSELKEIFNKEFDVIMIYEDIKNNKKEMSKESIFMVRMIKYYKDLKESTFYEDVDIRDEIYENKEDGIVIELLNSWGKDVEHIKVSPEYLKRLRLEENKEKYSIKRKLD
ncbi:MAG: hypothetical protein QW117_01055 [Candidatus Pacearchaeota archaeon]